MAKTQLMGILNVTPDSCFDQGRWFSFEAAIARGRAIWQEGADWLDIGGESTRPGATPVSETEELKRVIPILHALRPQLPIPFSIDTMKPRVAEAALAAGASLINDVSGFSNPCMRALAAESGARLCIVHMQGTPLTMQDNPSYRRGIIPSLIEWFIKRIDQLLAAGVKEEQIIIDPGIGFGKSVADNIAIVQNVRHIQAIGFPVLLGLSRKSFLGKIVQKQYPDLLAASLAANALAIREKVDFIRVHDVCEHRDVIDLLTTLAPSPLL